MNVVPIAAICALVCSAAARAQTPPVVQFQTGQSASDGAAPLVIQSIFNFGINPAGAVFADCQVQGSVSRALFISTAGAPEFIGHMNSLGSALLPPNPLPLTSLSNSIFNPSGYLYGFAQGGPTWESESSVFVRPPTGPVRGITDSLNPAPGVLSIQSPQVLPGLGSWVSIRSSDAKSLWIGDASQTPVPFLQIVQPQMLAPDAPPGVLIYGLANEHRVNSSGQYAYVATTYTPAASTNPGVAILARGQGLTQSVLARIGDPAVGLPGATYSRFGGSTNTDKFLFSDAGDVTLNIDLIGTTVGGHSIYGGHAGTFGPLLLPGLGTLAGVQGRVNEVRFDLSPAGQRVLWAGYNPAGQASGFQYTALFKGTSAAPQFIVRSGDPVPGLPPGTTFGRVQGFLVNDAGWVVFCSQYTTSPSATQLGIFGWTGGPNVLPVLIPGDTITFPSGVSKVVSSVADLPYNGVPTPRFNASGTVVLSVGFSDNSGAIVTRNIQQPAPPGGCTLTAPSINAQSVETQPTLTWTPASLADSYTVAVTPEGGTTSTFSTTATNFTVPAGVLQGCQSVSWGVTAVNAAGSTASTPVSQTFTTFSIGCITPPVYAIQSIGLNAPNYSVPTVTHVTPEGRVAGYNSRVNGTNSTGQDAWIWDGQMSLPLGLRGNAYGGTGDDPAITRYSSLAAINAQGRALGTSLRYGTGFSAGGDCWYYNGVSSALVGLTGPGYDRPPGSEIPARHSIPIAINPAGIAIGTSARSSITGANTSLGHDAWRSDGLTTQSLGPTGPEYDVPYNGETWRYTLAVAINASGTILGTTNRAYSGGPTSIIPLGDETWLQSGAAITLVRITGADYEWIGPGGMQRTTTGQFLNDAGHVAGLAVRRHPSGASSSNDAFRWHAGAFRIIDPSDAVHTIASTSARTPTIKSISAAGHVVGESRRYDSAGADLGTDVWFFDGDQTRIIGPTGSEFQTPAAAANEAATKRHRFIAMNAAGQVLGRTEYLPYIGTVHPAAGWVFDPATGMTTTIVVPPGYIGVSTLMTLTQQGSVLGMVESTASSGTTSTPFIWSTQTGLRLLGSRVLGGLPQQGWLALSAPVGGSGQATHGWPALIAGAGARIDTLSRRGYVLTHVPAPGGFPLLSPPDGASVDSPMTTHTWEPSTGASSYTVSFTPEGGTPTIVQTTATTVVLPASLAAGCEHITWTVIANAPTGSTVSTPPTRTFTYLAADYNRSGIITVQDIFDFLNSWFVGDPSADFNHVNGLEVQDIFDFLVSWFAGCS